MGRKLLCFVSLVVLLSAALAQGQVEGINVEGIVGDVNTVVVMVGGINVEGNTVDVSVDGVDVDVTSDTNNNADTDTNNSEWVVKIRAPASIKYDYDISDGVLYLSLNITLPSPCYDVRLVTEPMRCVNCYAVYVVRKRTSDVCTQVLTQVERTASIDLSSGTKTVYVTVFFRDGGREYPAPREDISCPAILNRMRVLRKEMLSIPPRHHINKLIELRKEYARYAKLYRQKCYVRDADDVNVVVKPKRIVPRANCDELLRKMHELKKELDEVLAKYKENCRVIKSSEQNVECRRLLAKVSELRRKYGKARSTHILACESLKNVKKNLKSIKEKLLRRYAGYPCAALVYIHSRNLVDKTPSDVISALRRLCRERVEKHPCATVKRLDVLLEKYGEQFSSDEIEKIEALREKIKERCEEIMRTPNDVNDVGEMITGIQIVKERLLESGHDVNDVLKKLKEREREIIRRIQRLREELRKIRIVAHNIAQRIRVRKGLVQVGDLNIPDAVVEVNTNEGNVEVKATEGGVLIEHEGVVVESNADVEVDENRIFVAGRHIGVLPKDLAGTVRGKVRRMLLKVLNSKPVYEVQGEREGRLLFILPVKVPFKMLVDAERGHKMREDRPWWSALVW